MQLHASCFLLAETIDIGSDFFSQAMWNIKISKDELKKL